MNESGTTESAESTMRIANAFGSNVFVYTNTECVSGYTPVSNGAFLSWNLESKGTVYVTVKTSFNKVVTPIVVNHPVNYDENLIIVQNGKIGSIATAAKGSIFVDQKANSNCGYSKIYPGFGLKINYKGIAYVTIKTSFNKKDLPIAVNHDIKDCNFIVTSDGKNAYFTTAAKDNLWIDEKGINHDPKEKCKNTAQSIQQLLEESSASWNGTIPQQKRKAGRSRERKAPSGTTIPGDTQPPSTGAPQGSTAPPQPSSGAPQSPGPTGTPSINDDSLYRGNLERVERGYEVAATRIVARAAQSCVGGPVRPVLRDAHASSGAFRESRPCRISACPYPQPSCCPPFNIIYVNGTFACGPQNDIVMAEYLKEMGLRASTTTRAPTSALIATRPHRTSPSGGNGATTTQPPGSTPAPTGGPQPTGPGTAPTGAPGTTGEPDPSTGAPGERTTEAGGVETTAAGVEDEMDARPWYHRLKPMQKRPIIGEEVEVTTEEGAETTTEEDDNDPRPWYHRLGPIQRTIEASATPMWLQFLDLA
ncbi:hypothetical protein PRIPAC_85203 [Pristionchus pacificus]|nr:hypothetical protein PRIPAC_85203 [Pristionchus pacificus]|eukprot:PDM67388.1 hypothetical protein PRIPAC_48805 [Pristionchus pacificus]